MNRCEDPGCRPARPKGSQAVVGVVIAIIGMLAAANPTNVVLRALHDAAPQLATAIASIISACGAVIAALSPPPRLGRRDESE
jgi:hypothetical protein